jgi:hypothetical protein
VSGRTDDLETSDAWDVGAEPELDLEVHALDQFGSELGLSPRAPVPPEFHDLTFNIARRKDRGLYWEQAMAVNPREVVQPP